MTILCRLERLKSKGRSSVGKQTRPNVIMMREKNSPISPRITIKMALREQIVLREEKTMINHPKENPTIENLTIGNPTTGDPTTRNNQY
jgi:hypothetical protein